MTELNVAREQDNAGEVDASPVVERHPPPSACSPRPVLTDLMSAAREGNSLKMMSLLRANAEIDEETALLAAKANVNHASKNGRTALMCAVLDVDSDSSLGYVQALLDANADVDTADATGKTALMISAHCETGKVCQTLVDAGASVNRADEDGTTALMFACQEDNESCAKTLLSANADADQTDRYRYDAMDHARYNSMYLPRFNSIDCIHLLLKPRVQLLWRTVRRAVAKHFMAWYLYQALWARSNGVEKDLRRLRMFCETRMTMMVEDDHDVTPQQHKRKRACYILIK